MRGGPDIRPQPPEQSLCSARSAAVFTLSDCSSALTQTNGALTTATVSLTTGSADRIHPRTAPAHCPAGAHCSTAHPRTPTTFERSSASVALYMRWRRDASSFTVPAFTSTRPTSFCTLARHVFAAHASCPRAVQARRRPCRCRATRSASFQVLLFSCPRAVRTCAALWRSHLLLHFVLIPRPSACLRLHAMHPPRRPHPTFRTFPRVQCGESARDVGGDGQAPE